MEKKILLLKKLNKKYSEKLTVINSLSGSKRIKAIDELSNINKQVSDLITEIGNLPG